MRDAESALDQIVSFRGETVEEADVLGVFGLVSWTTIDRLATAVLKGDAAEALTTVTELDEGGRDLQRLVQELLGHFRNVLVWTHAPDLAATFDLTEAQLEGLKTQAALADGEKLLRVVEILTEAATQARFALSRRTVVEVALLKAARAATVVSLDELMARIEASSADSGAPAPSAIETPSPARMAESPPPTPPAASPAAEVATLQERWAAILERVAVTAQMAAPYLKEAAPLRVEGDHVVLGFDPEFEEHLARVQTPRALQAIEQALRHELRRQVGVRFVVEDRPQLSVADPPPVPAAPPKKKSAPRKTLANDPAVMKTIEAFGAEVIEIRD